MKQLKVIGVLLVCLLAALTTGLWAQPLQEQEKVTPPVWTGAPPTETAQGGLLWFTNQAEFEAFNAGEGNVLKGTEDYEESVVPPDDVELFDDPLQFGIPNGPFPLGLEGLQNLIVQSNTLGGNPFEPSPKGVIGLAAVSAGFAGAVSDVVVADFPPYSLDLIFTDEKSGLGFNTITIQGGTSVEVRVYSTTNVFLGAFTHLVDPAGTFFIGVLSDIPIGRINIFDPSGGFEGGDNIQAWEVDNPPCPADLDGNGNVGASDLLALLANWGPCP